MNLVVMDIPDDPAYLPGWLERRLTSSDLRDLVAELQALHGEERGPAGSVRDLLGADLEAVVSHGLAILPADKVRSLLRRPVWLLELQEIVLCTGSPYWDRLTEESIDLTRLAEAAGRRLAEQWGEPPRLVPAPEPSREPVRIALYRRPWFVGLATAAAVLLMVRLLQPGGGRPVPRDGQPPPPDKPDAVAVAPPVAPLAAAGWGWNRPGALDEKGGAASYLERLVQGAGDWFKQRPQEAPALAQRLGEFRQGCSALIFAEHKPLAEDDRRWLLARCRSWAARLDKLRTALEDGKDVAQVRQEADALAKEIGENLRLRAEAVGAG